MMRSTNVLVTASLAVALACAKKEPPPPAPAQPAAPPPPPEAVEQKAADKPKADLTPWEGASALDAKCASTEAEVLRLRELIKAAKDRTLENVLGPYNELGAALDHGLGLMGLMKEVHPDDLARKSAEACERKLQRVVNDINLDRGMYEALSGVPVAGLDGEAKRFVEKLTRDFKRAGVDKDEPTRKRLTELHDLMVQVGQDFNSNIRNDQRSITLDSAAELDGLPQDFIDNHKPDAAGKVTVTTNYPDYFPVETYAKNEGLRKRLTIEFLNRGYPKNEALLKQLLELRFEYAKLLGYPTWAAYQAEDKMVKTTKSIEKFIAEVSSIARPRMKKDLTDLLARKKKDDPKATEIANWDRFYYVDKVRSEKFGVDAQTIRQYFDYPKVEEGILALYGELFGLTFVRVPDAPVWHPSVKAFEMMSGADRIGRFYLDMHPREGKYGHAAMFNISTGLAGGRFPEAALVCNFADPEKANGGPALMEHGDVITFFHEFGHLIHQLLARDSKWINQSGINVEWDFVEAPSQLLEEWAWDPVVLARFAKKDGEPIPAELVVKMKRASEFGKGIHVMRQVAYTALSYELHAKDPKKVDILPFMKEVQKKYSPYPYIEGTHEYAGFGHLEGYSSMYYTYQWSLVLAKDIFTRFEKAGLLDRATFADYRAKILAPGGMRDAGDLVTSFLGRPWNLKAYKTWLEKD